ncbi:ABC transporter six-transmembrane domain-containing protein [Paenibacillus kribbensis]|uniref:ABC transporter six-transmembrane domain-containing protein n=1 Tax=Paenibacillus kribbensis TaxID=172713 RepID=UPI002DBC3578|nr:ABC transporter six-transmembrane domain-containing protein [Paenibacillus kribbensis]MEC0236149.1 ABC transporter six-transmembrane domain-containing protein [Paenibacillus kribbensis]
MKKINSPTFQLLHHIWFQNYKGISITYLLIIIENICNLLQAAAIGLAIDGLLKGNLINLLPISALWIIHLSVGLYRHVYDTKIFGDIYSRIAFDMIPIVLINRWFGRRAYRLNNGLNNRIEVQSDIIMHQPLSIVRHHFNRMQFWRISISNTEAITWGIVDIMVIILTVATLLRLTHLYGITVRTIYAIISYIWMFKDAVNDIPVIVDNVSRVYDIGGRVAEKIETDHPE